MISEMTQWIMIALWCVLGIGSVVLQVFLSRHRSRWLGLILPVLSLVVAIFMATVVLSYWTISGVQRNYSVTTENGTTYQFADGESAKEFAEELIAKEENGVEVVFEKPLSLGVLSAITFAVFCIPTVVYLVIYAVCRYRRGHRKDELQKMRITELE